MPTTKFFFAPAAATPLPEWRGLRGYLLDAPSPEHLRGVRDGAILLHRERIYQVGAYEQLRQGPEARGLVWEGGPGCLILPGLVDLHGHLPQYPAVARPATSLLPWLQQHIFPLEKRYHADLAATTAPLFFRELARHGITQSVLYAAIYEDSCEAAFAAARDSGLRVVLGKVMMDRDSYGMWPPEKILPQSVEESRRLIERWHGAEGGRLEYAVTPRFAVACSREMLVASARLAREYGTYLQTHLAENHAEIARVAELFPEAPDYTGVYEAAGLLGPRTLLAHCLHLSDREIGVLASTGSVVIHCPTSNLFLRSGILPYERLRRAGVRLGVGHDVAGGPELNTWRVLRAALESQVARSFFQPGAIPSLAELFYWATLGGAEALGKAAHQGSLEPGKWADLVVLDLASLLPGNEQTQVEAPLSPEELACLLIHRGGPENTLLTLVGGRVVFAADRLPLPEVASSST